MAYLYHGTSKEHASSIRKKGLIIPKTDKQKNYDFSRKSVYFTSSPGTAAAWPHNSDLKNPVKKGKEIVFKVDKEKLKKLRADRNFHEPYEPTHFEHPGNVSPKLISRKYRNRVKGGNLGFGKKWKGISEMQNESEHLMYRASTKHLRTYLNFMKMRTAQGLATPADEEMVKKAQKHYSTRLLHNVLTSKNIKEEWEQLENNGEKVNAWVNSNKTIAIAETTAGEFVSLGKDGKRRFYYDTLEDAMKNEEAPTNNAGGGAVAGIGISSPTIKNPNQSEPGIYNKKKKILKRFAGYFKKA